MLRPMDIWRCAIVKQSAETIVRDGVDPGAIVWLPDMPPGTFRADPFGLWRDGCLYVFAEAFDYRTRVGHIDVLMYDRDLNLLDCRTVLKKPWHLSYPVVFEASGETWMLPEAYKSGTLTLYRAGTFPSEWEPVCDIPLDGPAIDATPLFHEGKWWLFYSPSHSKIGRRGHLHVAWADHPTGPWHLHPLNPVRIDLGSARPGGTPRLQDGVIILPVQDCRSTYGAAIRELSITHLDETSFIAADHAGVSAAGWMAPFTDGFHTLASAGPVTLIDVKRMDASLHGKTMRLRGIVQTWRKDAAAHR
ncbi:MAG: glucosamine inositolphosphorylceramide transferase family protein [Janthinobacterium lividum]